ncbi:7557_t:CDS:2, partial [Dentiscutata heterogama]
FDIFVKCNRCLSFPIKYPVSLYSICGFWAKYDMNIYIPIQTDNDISLAKSSDTDILETALKNIFNLSEYREYQGESIESFINGHNTLMILKTGGIPAAAFYTSSEQPPELQEKIFGELASGLTKILLITPKKYILNMKFRNMLKKINYLRGLQFVIDKAHCIKEYEYFRPDLKLEIISKPHEKEKLIQAIILVIDSITNRIYHSSMKSTDCDITLKLWKDGEIRFMSATNTFRIEINISDIRAIIHTIFPMSLDSFIQEIGHAGHDDNGERNIIFFSRADLHTLTLILYGGHKSIQENIKISQEFDESSIHYCENKLEYRQQLAYQIFTWPKDPDIPECYNCNNCCRCKTISTEWWNVSNELLRISRDDIANCFMGLKGKNAVSKDLSSIEGYGVSSESCSIFNEDCLYLIDLLILVEIITKEVDIKYYKEAKSLSYSSSLVGLKENALNFISTLE